MKKLSLKEKIKIIICILAIPIALISVWSNGLNNSIHKFFSYTWFGLMCINLLIELSYFFIKKTD
jgi:hypothetical protein